MKIHVFREEGVVWCCADWSSALTGSQVDELTIPKWSLTHATCRACLEAIVGHGQRAAARLEELTKELSKGGA